MRKLQVQVSLRSPLAAEFEPASGSIGQYRPLFDEIFLIRSYDATEFLISPFVEQPEWEIAKPGAPARAFTSIETDASFQEVVDRLELSIEDVLDQLSFGWRYPVEAYQLELVDLTPPVSIGEKRRIFIVAGYQSPKFRETNFHFPSLDLAGSSEANYFGLSEPARAALRWYSIGLRPQPDVQRFVAFWIALELVITEGLDSVDLPYMAPCGHEIPNCPTCNKETKRRVGGATIQRFLTDQFGISAALAKTLWQVRMAVHGANRLTPKAVKQLPECLGYLWQIVERLITQKLGGRSEGPIAPSSGTAAIFMEGEVKVSLAHLEPFRRTFEPITKPIQRMS